MNGADDAAELEADQTENQGAEETNEGNGEDLKGMMKIIFKNFGIR